MLDKAEEIARRYDALNALMADPANVSDQARLAGFAREQSDITEVVNEYRAYRAAEAELTEAVLLSEDSSDPEMADLARGEVTRLNAEQEQRLGRIRLLLLPRDPKDEKNVIIEVRAGTGGDEAALFAADLLRMYSRYAETHNYKIELLSQSDTGIGGFKEVIFQVRGRGAYSRLKYESGVHRVQRVPTTEAQGRIHTSTATVAVLPEVDEVEVNIRGEDIKIDVFRATGPGGQSVNTTDSAVRITHLPTGMIVSCQDEKSQLQNRIRGMQILRARLYQLEEDRRMAERSEARRSQVGSGERSEKIRTYNFPQNRVTDHRIGKTVHNLSQVMAGDLDDFIDELATADQSDRLQVLTEE